MTDAKQPIASALSGGGIRAMAFHLGVFKRLAELSALERVSKVSSVLGGRFQIALTLHPHGMAGQALKKFKSGSTFAQKDRHSRILLPKPHAK
jgi:NTE family protein